MEPGRIKPERVDRKMQKAHLTVRSRFLALVPPRTCVTPGIPSLSQTCKVRELDFQRPFQTHWVDAGAMGSRRRLRIAGQE